MGFIENIATYVKKYAPKYNITVHSPIIAQAILESASGTSELAKNANNYFGLKYNSAQSKRCPSATGYYIKTGSEQNADGSYTSSTMYWQKFPNMDAGVQGYFDFLNYSSRYNNLKNVSDPETYLKNIKADGYATSLTYVSNLMAVIKKYNLTQYDTNTTSKKESNNMSNSSLVTCTVLSPNNSGKRTHAIDRITPHCVVGQLSASAIGNCFTSSSKKASCNYGIGKEGGVCLIVDESKRSWCSSSSANDQRAVTIECASDTTAPYAFNNTVYNKLIALCTDICKRNGKNKLIWFGDKNKSLNYNPASNEMVLTVHRWFANKSCPGDWMYSRMGDLASKVTANLKGTSTTSNNTTNTSTSTTTATNDSYPSVPFTVNVLIPDLNIRTAANGQVTGKTTGKGKFTITKVSGDWGLLKSNAGWIYLKNASYVKIDSAVAESATSTQTQTQTNNSSYIVKITASALNVRKGPGTNYAITGCIKDKGRYTIIEENNGWGLLKSKLGWISLKYTKKI